MHSLHDIFWGDADIARQLKKKHLFWNGKGKGRIKTMTAAILDCRYIATIYVEYRGQPLILIW